MTLKDVCGHPNKGPEFSDIGENSETRKPPKSGAMEGIFFVTFL